MGYTTVCQSLALCSTIVLALPILPRALLIWDSWFNWTSMVNRSHMLWSDGYTGVSINGDTPIPDGLYWKTLLKWDDDWGWQTHSAQVFRNRFGLVSFMAISAIAAFVVGIMSLSSIKVLPPHCREPLKDRGADRCWNWRYIKKWIELNKKRMDVFCSVLLSFLFGSTLDTELGSSKRSDGCCCTGPRAWCEISEEPAWVSGQDDSRGTIFVTVGWSCQQRHQHVLIKHEVLLDMTYGFPHLHSQLWWFGDDLVCPRIGNPWKSRLSEDVVATCLPLGWAILWCSVMFSQYMLDISLKTHPKHRGGE